MDVLGLNEEESCKNAGLLMNGNVISLKFDDAGFADYMAREHTGVDAKIKLE